MQQKITTQFLLARHGETEWNCRRRLQGKLDSPLTEFGKMQADSLADSLVGSESKFSIDLIVSSPLGRAISTAIVCQQRTGAELKIVADLDERHFGDWQGLYFDDLSGEQHFEQIFFQVTDQAPPNGESGKDCGLRVARSLEMVAAEFPQQNILVVTHGDAIRCFLDSIAQKSQCDAYSRFGNGKIFPVNYCHQSQRFKVDD